MASYGQAQRIAPLWPPTPPPAGRVGRRPATELCSATVLCDREGRTSRSNKEEERGLSEEVVTQMNSADKDPFAVNLLNLWKFIGNS